MKTTYTVKLGLSRLTSAALVEKGRNHVLMLTANPVYTTPLPTLLVLAAACDALEAANEKVLFFGGKVAYEEKRNAVIALENLIKDLAAYVRSVSAGDKAKILSAGFEVRKQSAPIGVLAAPKGMEAVIGELTGTIDLNWDAVYGSRSYQVWMTAGDPTLETGWSMVAISTKGRHTIAGLVTGKKYTFKVNAVGAAGMGATSEFAWALAA